MRPQLLLNAPSELTIFYRSIDDDATTQSSRLSGTISCANMAALNTTSIDVRVSLVRFGTFKKEEKNTNKRTESSSLRLLRRTTKSNPEGFDKADEVVSTTLTLTSSDSKYAATRFEFTIPAGTAPTTSFPSFSISYALVATSTLPWGQVLRTTHSIRISRRPVEPVPVQPTPTAYMHPPLALCVSFDSPDSRSRNLSAVAHLWSEKTQVSGLLEWEVEEIATITTPDPDAVPMSTALRIIDKGVCVYGPSPSSSPSSSQQASSKQSINVPFTITVPNDTEFPTSQRLDSCVLDAWSPKHRRCQKMGFELRLEQVLRISLHLDGHSAGGKIEGVGQEVYSVKLSLKGLQQGASTTTTGWYEGEGEGQVPQKYCIVREEA